MKMVPGLILVTTLFGVLAICGCGGDDSTAPAQLTPVAFRYAFGMPNEEIAWSIVQVDDGGYLVVGSTNSVGAGLTDAYIVRTDVNGIALWTRFFGGSGNDVARSICKAGDGYLICGTTTTTAGSPSEGWLLRINPDGGEVWSQSFGTANAEEGGTGQPTRDGGFVLVGTTGATGPRGKDAVLVKTDGIAVTAWAREYGGDAADTGLDVQQTREGGYILVGATASFGAGATDAWLVKTDPNGNEVWGRTFGGTGEDGAYAVEQTTDGGYVVAGYTSLTTGGPHTMWLVKADANGNPVWSRTLTATAPGEAFAVRQTGDGGFIVAGYVTAIGDHSAACLVKTDATGNITWTQTFGGTTADDRAHDVQIASDGGYVMAGQTGSYGQGPSDFWVIKTFSDGTLGE